MEVNLNNGDVPTECWCTEDGHEHVEWGGFYHCTVAGCCCWYTTVVDSTESQM